VIVTVCAFASPHCRTCSLVAHIAGSNVLDHVLTLQQILTKAGRLHGLGSVALEERHGSGKQMLTDEEPVGVDGRTQL
jgi:hypothetical protein